MWRIKLFINVLLLFLSINMTSQKSLRISKSGVFGPRQYELFVLDDIVFKKKGSFFYQKHKIINLADSLILLDNDSTLKFSDIKKLKINKRNALHDFLLVNSIKASIIIPAVNIGNNLLFKQVLRFDKGAIVLTAACMLSSIYFAYAGNKRVAIDNKTSIRTVHLNYRFNEAISVLPD